LSDVHYLFDEKQVAAPKEIFDKSGNRAALKIFLAFNYYINPKMLRCSICMIYLKRRKLIVYMNQVIDKSEN
jgi:hypothetical protein